MKKAGTGFQRSCETSPSQAETLQRKETTSATLAKTPQELLKRTGEPPGGSPGTMNATPLGYRNTTTFCLKSLVPVASRIR